MNPTRSLLDACRLARLTLPVSHDDLCLTYATLAEQGIDHNLTDTPAYAEMLAEGLAMATVPDTADLTGAHVTMPYQGRTLLGEVTGATKCPDTDAVTLMVRYFNRQPWPIRPSRESVTVLVRTYPDAEDC